MVSKNKINFIISLQKKKVRDEARIFVIEGDKMVKEFLLAGAPVITLVAKAEFLNSLPAFQTSGIKEIIPATHEELKKISFLKTPQNAIALVTMPQNPPEFTGIGKELTVALDCVQDPGNLGTIIRAAAWFGIKIIYCSEDCADIYNPKVIQSSMGAFLHVNVQYTDLKVLLKNATESGIRVYGALMEGNSIYSYKLNNEGIIVLGNESKGISSGLLPYITDMITIPNYHESRPGIDSLNVGMAASVIFSEFTRSRGRLF